MQSYLYSGKEQYLSISILISFFTYSAEALYNNWWLKSTCYTDFIDTTNPIKRVCRPLNYDVFVVRQIHDLQSSAHIRISGISGKAG